MIAWFARNGVAANLLMAIVVVGGLFSLPRLTVELFPELSLDQVLVQVPYPGATPSEVEEGIVLRVEEAVQGVQGIRRIQSTAREGFASVSIEVQRGYDIRRLKEDIKTRVDAITTFPINAERPIIEELLLPRDLLYIAVAGDTDETTLRRVAERVRDDLVQIPGISQADLLGVRNFEISIEVSEQTLKAFGLTFDEVAEAVRQSSLDLPAGSIRAESGEILLRTLGQAYDADAFGRIPLRTNVDGTSIRLADLATIDDGFAEPEIIARFDGKPAAFILVRQVSEERPLDISEKVENYIAQSGQFFPAGIQISTFADASFYLGDRIGLLVKNGLIGLLLVLLVLTAFLRPLLAIFVAIGIPVAFLGAIFMAPVFNVSINLISLFAFILVLGIVVDDAIVIGESVFSEYQRSGPSLESSIRGSMLVAMPVTFAVLTTMVAFLPVFFIPGMIGKFLYPIPIVVIATLAFSLVQSKLVLPYHLSLIRTGTGERSRLGPLSRLQRRIADGLEAFVRNRYQPLLARAMRRRYLTLVSFVSIFIFSVGLLMGGWVRFAPFPTVPHDYIVAELEYPMGTPVETTRAGVAQMEDALERVIDELKQQGHIRPIDHQAVFMQGDTHHAVYLLELSKSEERTLSAIQLANLWREAIGDIAGSRSLSFMADTTPTDEKPIDIQLTGRDFEQMQIAARAVREGLREFPAVFDITDNFTSGKQEIRLSLKPEAEALGVRVGDLGRQVRQAFFGAEAQRIQRGRNDIRVMVRYPRHEREHLQQLEQMRIRLADGQEIPFSEVAEIDMGQSFATINRLDRQRVLNITANIDRDATDFGTLISEIRDNFLPRVLEEFDGISGSMEGEAAETAETIASVIASTTLVMFIIYALLAIAFRSYVQPLIVMAAIPFAFVGAIFGHLITFQNISILSLLGLIAAFGVVVNASLVMVDFVNQYRADGSNRITAVMAAGSARFRPILLTSLTTFVGLTPILLERSLQAQFLIPMATSLAFGVLFASAITLLLVPALYLVLEDIRIQFRKQLRKQ